MECSQPRLLVSSESILNAVMNSKFRLIPLPTSISYISEKMGFNCTSLFKHGLCYDEDFNKDLNR